MRFSKRTLGALLLLSACVPAPAREAQPTQCTFRPEGEEVFVDCSDNSHFQAPVQGGIAYGFDRRGNDLDAYVTLRDGHYSIVAS